MKNIQKILFIAVISALINACSQDFLNLKPIFNTKKASTTLNLWIEENSRIGKK